MSGTSRAAAVAVALLVLSGLGACAPNPAPRASEQPARVGADVIYALALDPQGRGPAGSSLVAAIDGRTGTLLGDPIRLRSVCFDAAIDSETMYTGQTGGASADADNALGIVDLRSGDVRYLDLPYPAPSQVALGFDGNVYVSHDTAGFDESGSLVSTLSVVDPATDSISGAQIPGTTGLRLFPTSTRLIFDTVREQRDGTDQRSLLCALDYASAETSAIASIPDGLATALAVRNERNGLVVYASVAVREGRESISGHRLVALADSPKGFEELWSVPTTGTGVPVCAEASRGDLFVGVSDEEAPESGAILVFDAATGVSRGRIDDVPGPVSMLMSAGRLWVAADYADAVIAYDRHGLDEVARVPVGVMPSRLLRSEER